ncbi:MAG: alkaline phosphatase family protein, partial [Acidobacteriota bacterium]|nr:alkaline phosphatase family protein [Acidobacteriota bacterium]
LPTPDGLYATPVQIDPESPALPISHPRYYATYLAKLLGTFSTLGMAEDTHALNEGAIDHEAFLNQAAGIQKEREAMYFSALERTRHGVVACVFDTTDRVQHMCFERRDVIDNLYRDMDRIVGETLKYADPDTALFVLSDHGFCSFRRGVNLNTWLEREGYLVLKGESGEYLEGIDWTRTRAYSFGLGGVYLNIESREAQGIVAPAHAQELRHEIADKLTGLRDGDAIAIEKAYLATDLYRGPYLPAAPDIIVGYADGYRASWDAAIGKVSKDVFEDNTKAWRGDHCVDPHLVPGVLFSNRPLIARDPGIEDMAPTALSLFGVARPSWMEGSPVCS